MENLTTEFKREFTTDLNKEIIAFANTDGVFLTPSATESRKTSATV